ncbi:guanosine-3',5'-bis(diphosphate) 3'-pyrophosphohydrolase MESH1-like [Ctenocephalides felis]|uniref:guanosine-3',5'-bis(diphosphate) 3'-pyrophosphohydrolase MESH1-like n=1 Tax=Ctenocephalides felis TaxID=7515 RepID=UPI000E6E28D3|nr:guanosine-3',5'-bis(diphosphate) 3'-pyrophosphohydrolase MESH1-like [Ctenocephalides felis]
MSHSDIKLYTKCLNFAAKKHKDHRRMDAASTPYVNHVIGTAYILSNEAGVRCQRLLMAAFLHDTVETTNTSFEEIESYFGKFVRDLVEEVSDDMSLPKPERKRLQIERAPNSSFAAKLLKLADKLYNLRDLDTTIPVGWTEEDCDEYFEWAAKVIKGLRGTNAELEKQIDIILQKRGVL